MPSQFLPEQLAQAASRQVRDERAGGAHTCCARAAELAAHLRPTPACESSSSGRGGMGNTGRASVSGTAANYLTSNSVYRCWTDLRPTAPLPERRRTHEYQSGILKMLHRTFGAITLVALAACSSAKKDEAPAADTTAMAAPEAAAPAPKDIIETAVAAGTFNTLAKALTEAGLIETLKGTGPFTVLAPTDEAFAKIPAKDLEALLADKAALTKVLTYHVIAGNVPASQVTTLTEASSLEGSKIAIKVVDGKVMLNGAATVVTADVAASNGVIHIIDTVLMPPKK